MSSSIQVPPPPVKLSTLPIDQSRGLWGMWTVIATESMLFACFFAAYYYLGNDKDRWAIELVPDLINSYIMLGILLVSVIPLYWGQRQVKAGRYRAARLAMWLTVACGIAFLIWEKYEYAAHLKLLTPDSDSYGSIFYAIETLDAGHVILGVMMMIWTALLPRYGDTTTTPHRPYQVVALYWYYVVAVWLFIEVFLYSVPNIQRFAGVH